jgi:hypothetical protein
MLDDYSLMLMGQKEMLCSQSNCNGEIENSVCNVCGTKSTGADSTQSSVLTSVGQNASGLSIGAPSGGIDETRDRRSSQPKIKDLDAALKLQKVSMRLKAIECTSEKDQLTGKDELLRVSETLSTVVPDKFEAWRAQADLWLTAIHQLELRQLLPDDNVSLMGVPLRENELRDATEEALRQCAHFANTVEERIALIDEANKVRRMSWF